MAKKAGKKKTIIIISVVVLLVLAVPFTVMYYKYTKEVCVIEPLEHMEQKEGVSMKGILAEITYSVIMNGKKVENCFYIFDNGDVYSGYYINYFYVGDTDNQEQNERHHYFYRMDDRYWDYLYEQCYWGRLSSRDLNGIINEFSQVEVVHLPDDAWPEPVMGTRKGMQTGTQTGIHVALQLEPQEEQTNNEENEKFYGGHTYRGRMEFEGTEGLEWISRGSDENVTMYWDNEHAHNAIDIIKSTWAYEQWTNQLFGEGWEERIDLKDELEEVEREREAEVGVVRQWTQYWNYIWDSVLK